MVTLFHHFRVLPCQNRASTHKNRASAHKNRAPAHIYSHANGSRNKSVFFVRVFANIFSLVYRMVTIVLLTQRTRLSVPSDTLNMLVKSTENLLEVFEKKFQPKKLGFVRIFQPDFELHFFKISTFFTFPDI